MRTSIRTAVLVLVLFSAPLGTNAQRPAMPEATCTFSVLSQSGDNRNWDHDAMAAWRDSNRFDRC
jgi:hypothetical protein